MGAYDYRADPSPTADDQIATERVVNGVLMRLRSKLEDMKARATGGDGTERTIADWLAIIDGVGASDLALIDQDTNATAIGAKADPASGTVTCTITRFGKFFTLDFVLTAARITVTDAAGSGSSGSLKIFDFVQGGVVALACRQNYTAFAEGEALTGAAGDAAFVMGLGSAAANAGDGALTGAEVDFGAVTDTITLSEGTGAGTKFSATPAVLDGTGTPIDLYLNWSGSAATIDASSTIDVTGTVTIAGMMLGDD